MSYHIEADAPNVITRGGVRLVRFDIISQTQHTDHQQHDSDVSRLDGLFNMMFRQIAQQIERRIDESEKALVDPNLLGKLKRCKEMPVDDHTCPICLMSEGGMIKLKCGHRYHLGCIEPWVEQTSTCPNCRAQVDVADDDTK